LMKKYPVHIIYIDSSYCSTIESINKRKEPQSQMSVEDVCLNKFQFINYISKMVNKYEITYIANDLFSPANYPDYLTKNEEKRLKVFRSKQLTDRAKDVLRMIQDGSPK